MSSSSAAATRAAWRPLFLMLGLLFGTACIPPRHLPLQVGPQRFETLAYGSRVTADGRSVFILTVRSQATSAAGQDAEFATLLPIATAAATAQGDRELCLTVRRERSWLGLFRTRSYRSGSFVRDTAGWRPVGAGAS